MYSFIPILTMCNSNNTIGVNIKHTVCYSNNSRFEYLETLYSFVVLAKQLFNKPQHPLGISTYNIAWPNYPNLISNGLKQCQLHKWPAYALLSNSNICSFHYPTDALIKDLITPLISVIDTNPTLVTNHKMAPR